MNTTMYIGGVQVDLSEDYPIPLNYILTDIMEPATRKASHSLTITLPGTPNNATIFKNIQKISKDNSTNGFDTNVRAVAFIYNGSANLLEGYVQLTKTKSNKGTVLYECIMYSTEKSLFSDMGDRLITRNTDPSQDVDLDGGMPVITYAFPSPATAPMLADAFADSSAVASLMFVDRGTGTEAMAAYPYYKVDWLNMRLALKFKHIWDRIFNKYGVNYQSSFISSAYFRRLVYVDTHKDLPTLTTTQYDNIYCLVDRTTDAAVDNSASYVADFNNKIADVGNQFNLTTDTFTSSHNERFDTVSALLNMLTRITFTGSYTAVTDVVINNTITVNIIRSGGSIATGTLSQQITLPNGTSYTNGQVVTYAGANLADITVALSTSAIISPFDTIHVQVTQSNDKPGPVPANVGTIVLTDSYLEIKPTTNTIVKDEAYPYKGVISDKHLQKEFVMDVLRMHNLYLLWDGAKYIIEPRDDFYALGTEHDWTDIVDRSQDVEIVPAGQINWKQVQFIPASDNNYYAQDYQKRFGESYGQQNVLNQNEFVTETKKVELKFTAPMSVSEDPRRPKVPHLYEMNNGEKQPVDGLPRYGYWAGWKEAGKTFFRIQYSAPEFEDYTGYPYVGEFDDPNTPTISVLFGPPRQIFYQSIGDVAITTNDLYNRYYNNDLNNQVDANARVITFNARLSPGLINNLKLYDRVTIDGVRCIISKITGYNAANPGLAQVELIQFNR